MNASWNKLSTSEFADKVGVSRFTVIKWANAGLIGKDVASEFSSIPRYEFDESDIDKGKSLIKKPRKKKKEEPVINTNKVVSEDPMVELLKENRRLRKEIDELRKEKEKFMSSMLELMARYE